MDAIVDTVFAAKRLERIGDHAKNMAEQVSSYLIREPAIIYVGILSVVTTLHPRA